MFMLDFVKAKLSGFLCIVIFAMCVVLFLDKVKISELKAKVIAEQLATQKVKTELSELHAVHLSLVIASEREALNAWTQFEAQKSIAQEARQNETATNKRLEVALRDSGKRVRNDLPAFAAGNTTEDRDNLSACRGRAQTLALLLDETLSVATEATAGAEQCGTDLRTMQAAWPRQVNETADSGLPAVAIVGSVIVGELPSGKLAQENVVIGDTKPMSVAGLDSSQREVGLSTLEPVTVVHLLPQPQEVE